MNNNYRGNDIDKSLMWVADCAKYLSAVPALARNFYTCVVLVLVYLYTDL